MTRPIIKVGYQPNILLKQARTDRGLTQEQLAKELRTSKVQVSRWESGATFPSPYYREQLCHFFEKKPKDLGLSRNRKWGLDREEYPKRSQGEPRDELEFGQQSQFRSQEAEGESGSSREFEEHQSDTQQEARESEYQSFQSPREESPVIVIRPSTLIYVVLIVAIVGGGLGFYSYLMNMSHKAISPNIPHKAATPTPTISSQPPPTPTLSYMITDWPPGLAGWNQFNSSQWSAQNHELTSNGAATCCGPDQIGIEAPYTISMSNIAVEATIKVDGIASLKASDAYLGLFVHITQPDLDGYLFGVDIKYNSVFAHRLDTGASKPLASDAYYFLTQGWHIFRLEIRNGTMILYIDKHKVISGTDSTYQLGGIGFEDFNCSIEVSKFIITPL